MNFREFISNNAQFNTFLTSQDHPITENSKILGIKWNTMQDILHFSLPTYNAKVTTKRTVLKFIASLYDPLGLLSPILVLAKRLLQKLWKISSPWDDEVACDLNNEWLKIVSTWHNQHITIDRLIPTSRSNSTQLHCFVDASGHTYGVVAYLRLMDSSNNITTKLVFAKNRLSPIKGMTIPRLELMAILIGSRMIKFLIQPIRCDHI
uniref:Pao retrotransposon peptidase n=1 Tax=Heterorhabditis bacteriophora TaxID=37862 RepID=A0A1I7XIX9_HETBA